ncbi:flavin-containing monooxygenase [Lichenicoccus roseus]|uniref:NAD(P)/FAD-dependent oxidoreductase n=1 Tax=Lichenicoccus roseus TaxID=2683649 RepID=A0A5R9J7K7_9PROT|nr:NAD(P)/FAD-dependent oxidoreductase [Lichenicoccus roseus]TLU71336.1 NAD(P)/FAD-dependent oxidoreductase [Lichenicoccus roseus]
MSAAANVARDASTAEVEHLDVIIIGAGLSGIGAACHLQRRCPGKSFTILEARERSGGTWDLFRYPGVRSDSDMYTLGYSFRPWREPKSIADGASILAYVRDTAREFGIDRHIRYRQRAVRAAWSSAEARWTLDVETGDTTTRYSCNFLLTCSGYYDYSGGYTPDFPGMDRFSGRIVHPQAWPQDLDHAGKRIVVIGSGATAVTLVPALAARAAHVTMLQRSPTYVVSLPSEDALANKLRDRLPASIAYSLIRWRNVLIGSFFYNRMRKKPAEAKARIIGMIRRQLGADFDVETHFTPNYNPWDQRLCLVPDSDLFRVLRKKQADVVTDHIEEFTPDGIRLRSGRVLETDLVVTATGLRLQMLGGMRISVDGRPVDLAHTTAYRGVMYSDVPNLATSFGYTNASWTLKCDLTCDYVCRLLNIMDRRGYVAATPRLRGRDQGAHPLVDFTSGYIQRGIGLFPSQGARRPWRLRQNYLLDRLDFRFRPIEDGTMAFTRRARKQWGRKRRAAS